MVAANRAADKSAASTCRLHAPVIPTDPVADSNPSKKPSQHKERVAAALCSTLTCNQDRVCIWALEVHVKCRLDLTNYRIKVKIGSSDEVGGPRLFHIFQSHKDSDLRSIFAWEPLMTYSTLCYINQGRLDRVELPQEQSEKPKRGLCMHSSYVCLLKKREFRDSNKLVDRTLA